MVSEISVILKKVIPHPLSEVNFLMVEIPIPRPYIFMIRVTRQIKCLIAQVQGGHTKFTSDRGWGMTPGPDL
jgi:hypothetical protein